MPLPDFDELYTSFIRVKYRERIESVQSTALASQGTEEGIKDIVKQWESLAYHEEMPTPTELQEGTGRKTLKGLGGF